MRSQECKFSKHTRKDSWSLELVTIITMPFCTMWVGNQIWWTACTAPNYKMIMVVGGFCICAFIPCYGATLHYGTCSYLTLPTALKDQIFTHVIWYQPVILISVFLISPTCQSIHWLIILRFIWITSKYERIKIKIKIFLFNMFE